MKIIKVKVQGMTCASCEVLLERGMKKVEGVQNVQVSRSKEKATIHCAEHIQLEDLQAAVADKGYRLMPFDTIETPVRPPFIVKNKKRYKEIGSALAVLIGAYFLLKTFNLIPEGIGITDNMSYGFVFVIGLVAATSTCLAVAGGLLLAIANKYSEANPNLTGREKFKPHIWFNIGRVASYTLLGAAIGALGAVLTLSSKVSGAITIAASVLMILMGLQLLQIFPWLNKVQLKMPKFIAHRIYEASDVEENSAGGFSETSKTTSFLFGASTFFLPCGFTQALQLYVLGAGSAMVGGLTMLAFSLGTLPALVGIGAFSSLAKGKMKHRFMTFSAILVIVLGIFNLPAGLTLVGANVVLGGGVDVVAPAEIELVDGTQIIDLEVRGLDYYPSSFVLKKGVPVQWNIDGTKAVGCAQLFSVPDLGINERLSRSEIKTLTFTPQKTGKILFSCSMGMAGPGVLEVVA